MESYLRIFTAMALVTLVLSSCTVVEAQIAKPSWIDVEPILIDKQGAVKCGIGNIFVEKKTHAFKIFPSSAVEVRVRRTMRKYIAAYGGFIEPVVRVDGKTVSGPFNAETKMFRYTRANPLILTASYLHSIAEGDTLNITVVLYVYRHLPFIHIYIEVRTAKPHTIELWFKLIGWDWLGSGHYGPLYFWYKTESSYRYLEIDPVAQASFSGEELFFYYDNSTATQCIPGSREAFYWAMIGVYRDIEGGTSYTVKKDRASFSIYLGKVENATAVEAYLIYGLVSQHRSEDPYTDGLKLIERAEAIYEAGKAFGIRGEGWYIEGDEAFYGYFADNATVVFGEAPPIVTLNFSGRDYMDPSGITYSLAVGRKATVKLFKVSEPYVPNEVEPRDSVVALLMNYTRDILATYNWTAHYFNYTKGSRFYCALTDIGLLFGVRIKQIREAYGVEIERVVRDNLDYIAEHAGFVSGGLYVFGTKAVTGKGYPIDCIQTNALVLYAMYLYDHIFGERYRNYIVSHLRDLAKTLFEYGDAFITYAAAWGGGIHAIGEAENSAILYAALIYYHAKDVPELRDVAEKARLFYTVYRMSYASWIRNGFYDAHNANLQISPVHQWDAAVQFVEVGFALPEIRYLALEQLRKHGMDKLVIGRSAYAGWIYAPLAFDIPIGSAIAKAFASRTRYKHFDGTPALLLVLATISYNTMLKTIKKIVEDPQALNITTNASAYTIYRGRGKVLVQLYGSNYTLIIWTPGKGMLYLANGTTMTITSRTVITISGAALLIYEPYTKYSKAILVEIYRTLLTWYLLLAIAPTLAALYIPALVKQTSLHLSTLAILSSN